MKQLFSCFLLVSLLLASSSCSKSDTPNKQPEPAQPILLTTKQGEKASADNRFAFKIFKEVSAQVGANTFFSPLSLNMALGMLYNGTSDDTRTEMTEVLGLAHFTETEINEYYQKMMQALLTIDPLTEISIANSIWYRYTLPVKQPFIDLNQEYFDAMVRALDFNKADAADIINQWCSDKTKERIKEMIQGPIDGDVMMYLINALYFKSKWQYEFDKKNTKSDHFTLAGGAQKKVEMMEQTTALPYYANERLQCVEMPYGNQAFSMVAILPAEHQSIEQLIDYLDDSVWQNIVGGMGQFNVWLKLPRFKVECEIPLNNPVKRIGLQRIFVGGLKNISDADLYVSDIKQKTFVEVNEEGTEAAAVTVVEIREYAAGPGSGSVPFFANRPFLYLIKERSTGAILFIGRMDNPDV
jgi:serpin B